MNEYKSLWEKFKTDINRHVEQGDVMVRQSEWLMSEAGKYCKRLDEAEIKLDTPNLPWDERQLVERECCEIIKIITEIATRMEIEQKRLLDGSVENIKLLEEYDRLEKIRQLDKPDSSDKI
jgi:hypothetical protein